MSDTASELARLQGQLFELRSIVLQLEGELRGLRAAFEAGLRASTAAPQTTAPPCLHAGE